MRQRRTLREQDSALIMRIWRYWFNIFMLDHQHNPPLFVEFIMLWLAIIMLGMWMFVSHWPYLVLCSSFVIGAAISILVREAIAPSMHQSLTQLLAWLLLIVGIFGFADLVHYL